VSDNFINSLPGRVFSEDFSSRASVLRNGGVPTDVEFSDGKAVFDGSSSIISYPKIFNGTYSIRFKLSEISISNQYLLDFRTDSGTGYCHLTSAGLLDFSSGTAYVNDSTASNYDSSSKEIVVTGISLSSTEIIVGQRFNNIEKSDANFDLIEIYEGTLSAEEVKLLYEGKVDKELSPENTLLDYRATNGVVEDLSGKNTLTPTDVSIKKNGAFWAGEFNGSTSKIDCGSDFIGIGDITIMFWLLPKYNSLGDQGIFGNGKLSIEMNGTASNLYIYGDKSTNTFKPFINSIERDKLNFIAIRLYSNGNVTVNVVIDSEFNEYTTTGLARLASGNTEIGNRGRYLKLVKGQIPLVTVKEGILSLEQITQHWAETRKEVKR